MSATATAPPRRTRPRESSSTWPLLDRLGLAACWATGLLLTLCAVGIVAYMAVKGVQYLKLSLLFEHPTIDANQHTSGGFLDPIEGTVVITIIGIGIAGPIGVGIAIWLAEFGRPVWLARFVESGVDVIAGVPSIVLAIFGLILFTQPVFSGLSVSSQGVSAYGRSFMIAGIIMSLIALPLMVGSTREALFAIPQPRTRGKLRTRQEQVDDDPVRPAPVDPAGNRDRRGARNGPHRRRHGNRHRAPRRDAAQPARKRRLAV